MERVAPRAVGEAEVIAVAAEPGAQVQAGDTLMVIESMKLETAIKAPRDGVVATVTFAAGQSFERDAVLVTPPVFGNMASSSWPLLFSLARDTAMLMSPAQPKATQALPPAKSSIMVLENKRMSLRTLASISPAALWSAASSE